MRIDKHIIEQKDYIFTELEARELRKAIEYVIHRQENHRKAGHINSDMLLPYIHLLPKKEN